jgi:hypothetical protein
MAAGSQRGEQACASGFPSSSLQATDGTTTIKAGLSLLVNHLWKQIHPEVCFIAPRCLSVQSRLTITQYYSYFWLWFLFCLVFETGFHYPSLAWNSQSCLSLPIAEITVMNHYVSFSVLSPTIVIRLGDTQFCVLRVFHNLSVNK